MSPNSLPVPFILFQRSGAEETLSFAPGIVVVCAMLLMCLAKAFYIFLIERNRKVSKSAIFRHDMVVEMARLPPQGPGHHDLENVIFPAPQTQRLTNLLRQANAMKVATSIGAGGQINVYIQKQNRERQSVKHMGSGRSINGDSPSCYFTRASFYCGSPTKNQS